MSSDEFYLDAIDAEENGDVELALELAQKAVKIDPSHSDAWWMISTLLLPKKERPTLTKASRSLNACRKIIQIDPDNENAWIRGGRILSDELGMYDKALEWWHERRKVDPTDSQAVIETVALLADLGLYHQSIDELQRVWEPGMRQLTFEQEKRLSRLHNLVKKVAIDEGKTQYFRPWNLRDPGWKIIKERMHRAPANETIIYLFLVAPVLLLVVMISPNNANEGFGNLLFMILMMLIIVMGGMRIARKISMMLNRPAFNLIRAMDIETTSGRVVITDDIRNSKLYQFLISNRPPAFRQRLNSIVDTNELLSKQWRPSVPNFNELPLPSEEE
ncbi:MAG: hypothetical protein CMB64_05820 [Euryarchaeota archaeon]|nr:hypothetical protein [Euryarchaeota archaeon]